MQPSTRDPQRKVRLAIDVFYFIKIMESDDKRLEAMRNTSDRISRARIIQCHLADGNFFWGGKQISVHRPSFFRIYSPLLLALAANSTQWFVISHSRSTICKERIEVCEQAINKWTCFIVDKILSVILEHR